MICLKKRLKNAERSLALILFMPLFTKFVGIDLEPKLIFEEVDQWANEISSLKSELILADDWLEIIQYFKELIHLLKYKQNIEPNFEIIERYPSLRIFKLLLEGERENITLNNAYIHQVNAIISLIPYKNHAKFLYFDIGKYVHGFWLNVAHTQKFAVSNPSLFLDELEAISPNLGTITLYEVLMSASRAVGVGLNNNVREQLKEVKKMARPWL